MRTFQLLNTRFCMLLLHKIGKTQTENKVTILNNSKYCSSKKKQDFLSSEFFIISIFLLKRSKSCKTVSVSYIVV